MARRKLSHFVKYNFAEYDENWHHRIMMEKLEAVERGEIKRLMVFMPPRAGKSIICAQYFPAWFLGRHPDKDVITASYSADLACDFGRSVRNTVDSTEYKNLFDTRLAVDSQSAGKWHTDKGGAYVASGVGGPLTGRGSSVLIIDDPVKNREEAESEIIQKRNWDWYRSTAFTRLSPDGAVVIVNTRWHDADLAGMILANAEEGEWDVVSFPAIATEDEAYRKQGEALWKGRWDLPQLENIKKSIGTYDWSALYQQDPLDEDSQEFKKEMFKYRSWKEVSDMPTRNFLTIDTAVSKKAEADYTAFTLNCVDNDGAWNIKSWHDKISPLELLDLLFVLYERYRLESIGIEKTMYLQTFKPFLDEEMRKRHKYMSIKELEHGQKSKELRIRGLLPRYESGVVYHVKDEVEDLENELLRFPKGVHDDCADSLAYQLQIAGAPMGRMFTSLADRVFHRNMKKLKKNQSMLKMV